jgi:hypothetical protein
VPCQKPGQQDEDDRKRENVEHDKEGNPHRVRRPKQIFAYGVAKNIYDLDGSAKTAVAAREAAPRCKSRSRRSGSEMGLRSGELNRLWHDILYQAI